jgi:hypothetical protein
MVGLVSVTSLLNPYIFVRLLHLLVSLLIKVIWGRVAIILATQEAEIRRITVRSQLRQVAHKTISRKYPIQKRADGGSKP